jgi:L-ascorbate metabolism protein UlaG (beta-lactamase superfamily)
MRWRRASRKGCVEDLTETLQGSSRGFYSNCLWHEPLGLVVEAGQGPQLGIGSVPKPTHLLITHDHVDHPLAP